MSPRNTQFSRDDIVEAAFQLVREQGWSGFSAQAVAKQINSSTMPIYSQFSNVRELEDEVCIKAMDLLKESLMMDRSGDLWIDQAINYVVFALEEKHLFRILGDGRNIELQNKLGLGLVQFIDDSLAGYHLFQGLSEPEFKMVRLARMMFAQRLAFWLNRDPNFLKDKGLDAEDFIRRSSKAIYDGFLLQFREPVVETSTANADQKRGKKR